MLIPKSIGECFSINSISSFELIFAEEIKSVIAITATPLTPPQVQTQTANPDWLKVEAFLGASGKHNGNLLQYSFPRNEKLTDSRKCLHTWAWQQESIFKWTAAGQPSQAFFYLLMK